MKKINSVRKIKINNSQLTKLELLEIFVINLSSKLGLEPSDFIPIKDRTFCNVLHGNKVYTETGIKHTLGYINNDYRLIFSESNENTVELYWIQMFNKGLGLGSEIMNTILDLSDEFGIRIRVIPVDIDNYERKIKNLFRLRNWYRSFGFKSYDSNRTPVMFYEPQVQSYSMVG
jgi:hypothetical protein